MPFKSFLSDSVMTLVQMPFKFPTANHRSPRTSRLTADCLYATQVKSNNW